MACFYSIDKNRARTISALIVRHASEGWHPSGFGANGAAGRDRRDGLDASLRWHDGLG
ncbi:MAG TPA: hypothetical protein VF628_05545 [Allosphingosinicella sp.]|jgi:hypothetical protein